MAGARELWRGQPAWIGYISVAVVLLASSSAPLVTLLNNRGAPQVIAIVGRGLATVLIARIVRGGWNRTGDCYVLTTAALYFTDVSLRRRQPRVRTIPLPAVAEAEMR